MEVLVENIGGNATKANFLESYLNRPYNEVLVHQVLVAFLSRSRVGSKSQKTRSEVSGGGRKPWKQKGTGRARAGTIRSPIWRSGGVTFAAKPRQFDKKVNKKSYKAAISVVFSELHRQGRLSVVSSLSLDDVKTKSFIDVYTRYLASEKHGRTYMIDCELDINLLLSSRNLPLVTLGTVSNLSFVNLIESDKVIISEKALKLLEGANNE